MSVLDVLLLLWQNLPGVPIVSTCLVSISPIKNHCYHWGDNSGIDFQCNFYFADLSICHLGHLLVFYLF